MDGVVSHIELYTNYFGVKANRSPNRVAVVPAPE